MYVDLLNSWKSYPCCDIFSNNTLVAYFLLVDRLSNGGGSFGGSTGGSMFGDSSGGRTKSSFGGRGSEDRS